MAGSRRRPLLLVLALLALAPAAWAQRIRVDAQAAPLEETVRSVAQQGRVDVVFAQRLVEGRAVTAAYAGDDAEAALEAVLAGSGLRAERVRRGQYVLVEAPEALDDLERQRASLSGVVRDAESGELLPGANVFLPDLGSGTVTTTGGTYVLAKLPPGLYRVRFSFVGYRTAEHQAELRPGERLTLSARLEPQPYQSTQVVVEEVAAVRADLAPIPGLDEVPARAAAALPAFLGENDLFGALAWLPGVGRSAEAGGELVVRGSEPSYNRYLLDGAPVVHPWHTFGLFSTYQTEALKSIRLYKGSLPAEYGDGLAAVLDAEMKDGEGGRRVTGAAALSPIALRGVAEIPVSSRLSVMLHARRTFLDLFLSPQIRAGDDVPVTLEGAASGDTQEISYYFFDAGAKATWQAAPGRRLSVSYYEGGDDLTADVPFRSLVDVAGPVAGGSPLGLAVDYGWGNRVVSTRYRGLHGRRVFVSATGYYARYRAREGSRVQPTATARVDSDYRVRFAEGGARVDVDFYQSLAHQYRYGLRLVARDFNSTLGERVTRSQQTEEGRQQRVSEEELEVVLYAQDTWQPSARWQIQPGVRLEYFTGGRRVAVNPRLHVRYVVDGRWLFLRGGVGRQTQYLHRLRDRYSFTYDLASSRWVPASEGTAPASAWQVGAGAEVLPGRGLSVSTDVFWRWLSDVLMPADEFQVKDGIEGPGIGTAALLEQYVVGSGQSFGAEVAARAERGPWVVGVNYAWGRSLVRPPGEAFRRGRYDIPHTLEGLLQRRGRRWSLSLAGTLRSGAPVTEPVARYALGDPLAGGPTGYLYRPQLYTRRLPTYWRVDLAVGYAFQGLGLDWDAQIQAYNLLNRRNAVGRRYSVEDAAVRVANVQGLPLLPMLNLRARW